ncbi:MAG: tetratricopeptide repeat protein [Deltaproteobacteria bacterium]|nr:tetratricopeptide repeat protein [Deltaproteobacteria bacterium]MDQ3298096.1 tetratricopeptide repeat protein [Myxococcota bacterium]
MKRVAVLVSLLGSVLVPATAAAQAREVSVQRGPASELYIRKRPPTPEAPVLSQELKDLLVTTEKKRDDKRLEAIGLLRGFLASKPSADGKAEGMFKLAELLWEEARRTYLVRMDDFARALEACAVKKGSCKQPVEPRIELGDAEALYRELHAKHPNFRRMDLVTYLIGFAAKEDDREDEAMARFQEVITRFPRSTLHGDAWMMVGEHYFAAANWTKARDAYKNIADDAATSDLATFKIAWCEWKLGNPIQAAKDFKRVLDKAVAAERTGTAAQRRRSASLRDEALEYLVVVFTEDRSISAKEVFDFLASIGGEQYSRDVLLKVAESYGSQTEWDRSNEAYRFLIKMDPESIKAAEYQRDIVGNWTSALDVDRAQDEIKVLLDNFGPDTPWAKAQKNRDALARSLEVTEELVRTTATNIHGEAQRREKADKKPDLALYTRAAAAYEQYLAAFAPARSGPSSERARTTSDKAVEVRYYRADILFFKLGKTEEAGDEYLAVGKTAPVGKFHKDALKNAMEAYEKARPKDTAGRAKYYPVDKKFGEAIDLYATLFQDDPSIVGVIFKNGQMFFDYGEYDEAIKRFGVIVTKYPKDPNAGPAGDRILSALNKAENYETIEEWARKLKSAPSFAAKDQQDRLSRLIVESIQKSGDKYAQAGKYEGAATFYLRVPKETADSRLGAQALMNAGVMYEKAKLPERAADIYLDLAEKYGDKNPEIAEKAAFSAGQVYEKVIYFDRAAKAYELVWTKFRTGTKSADALFNAGLLRQALGQNKEAIAHYQEYAKKFRERKDAPDVAFNIGVVYENAGEEGPAYKAYADYARTYRSSGKRIVEAWTRAGRMSLRLGQFKRAKDELVTAEKLWKASAGNDKKLGTTWAAEARYHQGELLFREYEKITLDVPPAKLEKALKTKSKLLAEAEAVYGSVIDYQDLKWATAALYRIGQIYDGFAESLVNASTPKGLSTEQAQAYRDALDVYVVDIQGKAVELFTAGYQKAIQMQVYDEYTAKIREALGRIAADKFPPERESRSKERIGDRPPTPELVTEIAR